MIYFVLGTAAFSLFMFLLLLPRNLPSTTVRLSRRLDPLIALLFLAGFLLSIVFKSVVMLAATVLAIWLFQRKRRELDALRERERLEAQFVDFLGILSSLYAATGDLVGSMDRAADGVSDPLASEIKATVREYRATNRLREALQNLAERMPLWSVRFFVEGVLQAEAFGADVGEVVGPIAQALRDRLQIKDVLRNEIRGQQLTVTVLLVLLPLMLVLSLFIVPQSREALGGTMIGQIILGAIPLVEYGTWALFGRMQKEVEA